MNKFHINGRLNLRIFSFCLLSLFIISLSSCATNGILGFSDPLATSSYVDNATATAAAESEKRIDDLEDEIKKLYDDIALLETDLKAVSNIKADLDELPREMLRELVSALQSYLDMLENEGS